MNMAIVVCALSVALAVLTWWPARLQRLRTPRSRRSDLARLGQPGRLLSAAAVGITVTIITGAAGWWAVLIGAGAAVLSLVAYGKLGNDATVRRHRRLVAALPQCCELIVVCLEAGLPVRAAVEAVSPAMDEPLADALNQALAKIRLGIDEQQAWSEMGAEPALAKLGRELGRGSSAGISIAARLIEVGTESRRTVASHAETQAKQVGVHSVLPLMLCFLPAFVLVGLIPIIGGILTQRFDG